MPIKISELTALTGANTATDDEYVIVDKTVPETKKQTRAELFQNVPPMTLSPLGGSYIEFDGYDTGSGGANQNVYMVYNNFNNDGYGDASAILYARGTRASPAVPQSGDRIGTHDFRAYDGTVYPQRAGISAFVTGSVSAGNTPVALVFHTGSTSQIERMRINSAGEVLIGGNTDNGAFNLQCNGTGVWGAGAYTNGSDERIKDDIAPLGDCLDIVN